MTNLSDIVGSSNVLTTNNTKTVTNKTISGSSNTLTNLPAANLTGTLPAIDGSNLTGISAGLDSAAVSAIIIADVDNSFVDALNADADTLDGVNSTSFLRSDTSDNFTSGTLEFQDNTMLAFGNSGDTIIEHDTAGTDGTRIYANTVNGNIRFQDGSTTVFDIARTAANTTTFFETVDFTNATVTGLSTGGGSGSGISGGVFLEYEKFVDSDYTIDSDGNGRGIFVLSAADDSDGLTIATGATVTVNSGSSWVLSGGDKNMGLDAMVATSNQTERTMRTGTIKPTLDSTYDLGDSAVGYRNIYGNQLIANNTMAISTNGGERMRIDSNGQVMIGTTTAGGQFTVTEGDAITIIDRVGTNVAGIKTGSGDDFCVGTADYPQAIRIKNNTGRIGIGETAPETQLDVFLSAGDVMQVQTGNTGNSNVGMIRFRDGDNNATGQITSNPSTNTTNYVTSSDYRLKENVVNMVGAVDRVKTLSPKRFNFISNADVTVDGFLAHEAQTVVPEAVVGEHNEVDDDGNVVVQGIDLAKLVPLLTGALQEAITEIENLEARITALENA